MMLKVNFLTLSLIGSMAIAATGFSTEVEPVEGKRELLRVGAPGASKKKKIELKPILKKNEPSAMADEVLELGRAEASLKKKSTKFASEVRLIGFYNPLDTNKIYTRSLNEERQINSEIKVPNPEQGQADLKNLFPINHYQNFTTRNGVDIKRRAHRHNYFDAHKQKEQKKADERNSRANSNFDDLQKQIPLANAAEINQLQWSIKARVLQESLDKRYQKLFPNDESKWKKDKIIEDGLTVANDFLTLANRYKAGHDNSGHAENYSIWTDAKERNAHIMSLVLSMSAAYKTARVISEDFTILSQEIHFNMAIQRFVKSAMALLEGLSYDFNRSYHENFKKRVNEMMLLINSRFDNPLFAQMLYRYSLAHTKDIRDLSQLVRSYRQGGDDVVDDLPRPVTDCNKTTNHCEICKTIALIEGNLISMNAFKYAMDKVITEK